MYPVLILRCELVCLVILIFLFFTSRVYNVNNESKAFSRLLFFAILHVIFDAITVLTVNHTDVVPGWLNWICHVIFYVSAILFSNEVVNYVVAICYPKSARKLYALGHILTSVYILCLPFLDIYYVADIGTYSSAGPAAIVGYGLAFSFFIVALIIIFTHMDMMSTSIKSALIPMMLVLMITEICQIIWRSVLFTGGAVTIVTVGFFFSLENPVEVFKKKAMTDALTGVRSRSSYDQDIEEFDKKFQISPDNRYTFVFIDLNDLRIINNRFGHAEGDNYISLIATFINKYMTGCSAVYRIGGDEFLILYLNAKSDIVEQEIKSLQDACINASKNLNYTVAVSAGYATSSESYKSLKDVVKTADYAMYQNKAITKSDGSYNSMSLGTGLNYSGLTDKIFEAICAASDKSYPFITNMDTNVTRIAPAWKEYFGLEDEFYYDFITMWKNRIHPDYVDGYLQDIISVINGHHKYHNYDYMARKADGEYVKISCHGSVYRDNSNGITYFSGFIINHGLEDNRDPITGLKNFDQLEMSFYKHADSGRPFSVIKLMLNSFARINMLYGYNEGNDVLRKVSGILAYELSGMGELFCQNGSNFSIIFDSCDKQLIEDYYRRISEKLIAGISISAGLIPILISGGAYIKGGDECNVLRVRSGLAFAVDESHYAKRNQLVYYSDIDDANDDTDIAILSKIHANMIAEQEYFKLKYQPIIDMVSGKVVGAEALLRWIHPRYGEIHPDKFIAFLENDPCYYQLGLEILEHAVMDAKQFQQHIPGLKININITAIQLQNENFTDDVFRILNKYDYAPGCMVLELTERCKEMEGKFLSHRIAEMRNTGLQIAFDDLGTGYSTISLLMDIPVDEIKLDKDFVRDLKKRENYQLFVKSLVFAQTSPANNYNICFEGIETAEMLEEVRQYGEFLVQGYYYSKPLLADEFVNYIQSNR